MCIRDSRHPGPRSPGGRLRRELDPRGRLVDLHPWRHTRVCRSGPSGTWRSDRRRRRARTLCDMTPARPVRHFGDSAVVIDVTSMEEAHAVAASIDGTASAGLEDVIVGYRSVTVVADPTVTDLTRLAETLASVASLAPGVARLSAGKLVEIPVNLDGSDLDEVARLAGMSPRRVVDLLTGTDLQVAFVGFAPGFAYLVGLDPDLAAVPRRPTPRPAVPAGSVALAGGFAGIYPQSSPGGWHLVGRTNKRMFDPATPPYS